MSASIASDVECLVDVFALAKPSTVPGLYAHHLEALRARALTDETIQANGFYSECQPFKVAQHLNRKKFPSKNLPALMIPYTDALGRNGYTRVRPDRPLGEAKYLTPSGLPNEFYIPHGVAALLADPQCDLLVTEGEFKAVCATQFGFPTIALVGVHGWKRKGAESLIPSLESVAWKNRKVYIVYDSDAVRNPQVLDGEYRLANQLTQRGAIVKVVRLPEGLPDAEGNPTKLGVDDFLARYDGAALKKLIEAAEDPVAPPDTELREKASDLDPATVAAAYLDSSRKDGVSRLVFWRGSWHRYRAGCYRDVLPSEVRADLVRFLDPLCHHLTMNVTANILDCVKAQAIFPGWVDQPIWRDEDGPTAGKWPAAEIMATKNILVHLPSFVAGKEYSLPPTPRFFHSSALDFNFDENATWPQEWHKFIDGVWPDDQQAKDLLQEWFGYLLTPDTSQQKILVIIGPKRSGKGTIARVARGLVGAANVAGPTLASFGTNFGLWPLLGKSLAVISDARLSGRTDQAIVTERLLSISGEDTQTVDRKNLEPVSVKLPARLMVLTNELPRLSDSSGALASRMLLLRMDKSFYGKEDRTLTDKLLAELPGILQWAIGGWARLNARGYFVQPDSGHDLLDDLHDIASPVGAFIKERCVVGPGWCAPVDELFTAWSAWCDANGRRERGTVQTFGRDLKAALPELRTVRPREGACRYRAYEGIGVIDGY